MIKYKAAFVALVMTALSLSAPLSVANAEDSYSMNVSVNLSGEKKSISPYIYGVNEYGNASSLKNVSVNAVRQGGNRYTSYDWETNYSNAGADWLNSSDTNLGDITNGVAYAAQKLSDVCAEYNVPYKMTTLQMAGYVAADKNGSVTSDEAAPSDRWNEVIAKKGSEFSLEPDLTDGVVYMDEYVNYLVKTLGDSKTATGIQGYSLDNEPFLWNDTHSYMHADEATNNELVSKSIELASAVKNVDPNAEVFGPALWGMLPCIQAGESGNGFVDSEWQAVKSNYNWYLDYYLDQMSKAEDEHGKRLLDVVDVHYYAQDCSTDDARLQAARSLYDDTYVENSWLQPYLGQYFPLIPNIQESIDKYYPGTKIAISEYNLANIADEKNTGKSVVSAIAEAEALGCFADNEVYLATYWGTLPECPYVESAINLYTNYDGEGASFGNTLIEAKTDDVSLATAYAAINDSDESEVTMVLSNKDMTNTENAVISLNGTDVNYKSAVVYAITQDDSGIRIIDVQNDIENNKITVTLPPLSVAQIVVSDTESDKEVYIAPDIETKETVYNYDDLEISANGYPMIPLGDIEHLTKAIINTTTTSSMGSSWYCGGGALTFSNLIDSEGTAFWGSKAFSYNAGTGNSTVTFDGYFTNIDSKEVTASIGDTFAELQNWWASSEKDEKGADVSVKFNTITLVYEYDNTESTTSPSQEGLFGDVNEDKSVNISDVVAVRRYLVNPDKYPLSEQGAANADVQSNGNGINAQDAVTIQKSVLGIVTELPV